MVRLFLLLVCSLFASSAAHASDWSGHWVARSGAVPLFDIHVEGSAKPVSATWIRPDKFSISGGSPAEVGGPLLRLPASGIMESGGTLSLTFRKPGSADDTVLVLRRRDDLPVSLEFANPPPEAALDPIDLQRTKMEPKWPEWPSSEKYRFDRSYPSNAEMKALFDADQGERKALIAKKLPDGQFDPQLALALGKADYARLTRTRQLLDDGKLNSGADFYYASFIFQHGGNADSYLLAHVLATAAMARGYDASWIASATLDRYLQAIGKPQVLGTQYQRPQNSGWSQAPYNSDLLPDTLRKAMGVPTKASQVQKMKSM